MQDNAIYMGTQRSLQARTNTLSSPANGKRIDPENSVLCSDFGNEIGNEIRASRAVISRNE